MKLIRNFNTKYQFKKDPEGLANKLRAHAQKAGFKEGKDYAFNSTAEDKHFVTIKRDLKGHCRVSQILREHNAMPLAGKSKRLKGLK